MSSQETDTSGLFFLPDLSLERSTSDVLGKKYLFSEMYFGNTPQNTKSLIFS